MNCVFFSIKMNERKMEFDENRSLTFGINCWCAQQWQCEAVIRRRHYTTTVAISDAIVNLKLATFDSPYIGIGCCCCFGRFFGTKKKKIPKFVVAAHRFGCSCHAIAVASFIVIVIHLFSSFYLCRISSRERVSLSESAHCPFELGLTL